MTKLTKEEKDFLIGVLENIKESMDMADSMEYGGLVNDLLDKLTKQMIFVQK